DVYDRSIPPVEAVELLNETLSKLIIDRNVSVMIISGNHDSGERLSFGSKILEKQGLYIAGSDDKLYKKVVLRDNNQNVNFYLVPYKDTALTKKLLNNKEIRSHNDVMIAVIDKIKEELNENEINILIGHGYVTMKREEAIEGNDHKYEVAELETSESERPLSIGGTDLIDGRSEEHTSELQSRFDLVCRLLLEKKKKRMTSYYNCSFENIVQTVFLQKKLIL